MAIEDKNKIITHDDGQAIATAVQGLASLINDQAKNVHLTGDQAITGLKSFETKPVVGGAEAVNASDLSSSVATLKSEVITREQQDKCYQALKTVTKDFTRTDPVYVRVGEDGEPEIHYTMTQADGTKFFEEMDLGDATLYVHNGKIVEKFERFASQLRCKRFFLDSAENGTTYWVTFGSAYDCTIREINAFKVNPNTVIASTFYGLRILTEFPAFDFTGCRFNNLAFAMPKCVAFHAYGFTDSFDLSYATSLGHDAILEVFNNLGTVDKTAGITLTLGATKLALMSDEEKAIATEKGWTLA